MIVRYLGPYPLTSCITITKRFDVTIMDRRLVDNIAKKVHMSSSDIGTMTYILEEKRLRKGGTVQKN
jgi:hypothetical protein